MLLRRTGRVSLCVGCLLLPISGFAAGEGAVSAPSKPVEPVNADAIKPVEGRPGDAGPLTFNGLLDVYYAYNFTSEAQNRLRAFDLYSNQIALSLAELSFKHAGREVSFKADLDFGPTADLVHTTSRGVDDVSKHLGQAILAYSPSAASGLTFSIGKMATHLGWEVIKAKDNWQYSRSFLFTYAVPLWHSGASVAYAAVPGKLNATVFVYNGWNTLVGDDSAKNLGLQLAFTPNDALAVTYNGISGLKSVHEVVVAWTPSRAGSLALDSVYGSSREANWVANSLAARVPVTSFYAVSPRIEVYRDNGGFTTGTGVSQTLDSLTLTNSFTLAPGFETRLEARRDHSTAQAFIGSDGAASDSQVSATAAFLYSF